MDFKDIASKVLSAAPILGALLGGPAGGAAGALIAKALGAESSDPKAILDAMQHDQEWVFKLQELEKNSEKEILSMQLQAATAELQAARDVVLSVNTTMQSESKSEDLWQRRWRPFIGFTFGAVFAYFTGFVCYLMYLGVINKDAAAMSAVPQLIGVATTLFGIPGAILGVTAWGRNQLKLEQAKTLNSKE